VKALSCLSNKTRCLLQFVDDISMRIIFDKIENTTTVCWR
jgi:hypothetical protein